MISNSNWTEWSTIQGVIARVISKLDEHEALEQFEIGGQLLITDNCIYNKFQN